MNGHPRLKRAFALTTVLAALGCASAATRLLAQPTSGIYQITAGTYLETGGLFGQLKSPLPQDRQAFLILSMDSGQDTASLTILGRDLRPAFPAMIGGMIAGSQVRFHYDTLNPRVNILPATLDYTVTDEGGSLRLEGLILTSPTPCCDIPYSFEHRAVRALLISTVTNVSPDGLALMLREVSGFWIWLEAAGAGTESFLVERSPDLQTWTSAFTVEARLPAINLFDYDAPVEKGGRRFYRAKMPGPSLDEQRQAWAALGLQSYKFRFRKVCRCWPNTSGTVHVRNGVVVDVRDARDERTGQPITDPDLAQFPSIEQLFDTIAEARQQKADVLTVAYDPELKYPRRIDVDSLAAAVDDEIRYEATDLVPAN